MPACSGAAVNKVRFGVIARRARRADSLIQSSAGAQVGNDWSARQAQRFILRESSSQ